MLPPRHPDPAQPGHAPEPVRFGDPRDGILRERFADVLTDALRAAILRLHGYRVDAVQFVGSEHTPRNILLRATRTDTKASEAVQREYTELTNAWHVQPALARMLAEPWPAGSAQPDMKDRPDA